MVAEGEIVPLPGLKFSQKQKETGSFVPVSLQGYLVVYVTRIDGRKLGEPPKGQGPLGGKVSQTRNGF